MAKTPKAFPVRREKIDTLETADRKINELIKVIDEMHRLRGAEIEAIEKRLTDGGL